VPGRPARATLRGERSVDRAVRLEIHRLVAARGARLAIVEGGRLAVGVRTIMNPPPPRFPALGCVTASANAVATAASTALPRAPSIDAPTSEASPETEPRRRAGTRRPPVSRDALAAGCAWARDRDEAEGRRERGAMTTQNDHVTTGGMEAPGAGGAAICGNPSGTVRRRPRLRKHCASDSLARGRVLGQACYEPALVLRLAGDPLHALQLVTKFSRRVAAFRASCAYGQQ
jgi:hypothetical protein